MKKLVLIRGLPGSGKSTMAKKMIEDNGGGVHLEADMYFMHNGVYKFDGGKIHDAHVWCHGQLQTEVLSVHNHLIVVSNTFVKFWEMDGYADIGIDAGWHIDVIVANGNYKNIHGVPDEVIERMRLNWEDLF